MKVKQLRELLNSMGAEWDDCYVVWPMRHPNGFASICHPFKRFIHARLKVDQMVESARVQGIDYRTKWLSLVDYEFYKLEREKMDIDLYTEKCVVLC